MCIASEEHGKYYSVHKQLICVAGDGNWTGKSALRASGLKTGDVWALQSLKAHKVQRVILKRALERASIALSFMSSNAAAFG